MHISDDFHIKAKKLDFKALLLYNIVKYIDFLCCYAAEIGNFNGRKLYIIREVCYGQYYPDNRRRRKR